MINVSNKFKEALQTNGKMIDAIITIDNGVVFNKPNIISIDYSYNGDWCKSLMCEADIELQGYHELKGKTLNIQFGVKQNPTDEYEYISLGKFIVKEQEQVLDTKSTKLECYDFMLQSMIPYDLNLTYPITVSEYLSCICERLGWTLKNSGFINSDKVIEEEKYNDEYTIRDVLDEIAQVSGSIIRFTKDNYLIVDYWTDTEEVIDYNLRKFSANDKYGPINSLVLSRTPQEDNVYRQDEKSIEQYGLTELKIENNQIMDKNRDDFIDDLFNSINGFEYYPFELESFGYSYLEINDVVTFVDPITKKIYKTVPLYCNLQITQGLNEVVGANIFNLSKTDYDKASKTDRTINETKLQVDKQNQTIEALVSEVDDQVEKLSDLTINVDGITSTVSQVRTESNNKYLELNSKLGDLATADEVSVVKKTVETLQTSTDYSINVINETLKDGVPKVKTEKGFTFSDDGMIVDETNSPTKSITDTDGITVVDKTGNTNAELLFAGYDPETMQSIVRTMNLWVKTYLMLGNSGVNGDWRIEIVEDAEKGIGLGFFNMEGD